jgi:polysaccharide biosynthesis transport protein
MELKDLITLYKRWFWLLIAGLFLGLVSGFVASKLQTPVYEVSSKVLVTRSGQNSTDMLSLSDQQLVLTYQQLLKTKPVLDKAGSRLGIEIDPDNIKVNLISGTQIIEIKVQDEDPDRGVSIANLLVQILIEENESLQVGRYTLYEESLNTQITQVQKQIENLQGQISEINQASITEQLALVHDQIVSLQEEISVLDKEIGTFPAVLSAADRAQLSEKQTQVEQLRSLLYLYQQIQTNLTFIGKPTQGGSADNPQVTTLQLTLGLYQDLYLNLLDDLESVKLARVQSTPAVSQIESAFVPEEPIRPKPLLYTLLSGIVGLLLCAGAVLLIDYFDETFKSPQKIEEILGIPVMAEIADTNHGGKVQSFNLLHSVNPSLVNAFAILRFNLNGVVTQKSMRSILITSPAMGEGKTTIAINLAAAFAQTGLNVVLVDADLHRPTLHTQLGLTNEIGLTDILSGTVCWQDTVRDCSGVKIITSGAVSSQSFLLLESERMSQFLKDARKDADIVVLDGPPLFIVDSQILASKVDGILLVIRQGNTIAQVARAMMEQLRLKKANVIGVVLNRVKRVDSYYYYDGYYGEPMAKEKVRKD